MLSIDDIDFEEIHANLPDGHFDYNEFMEALGFKPKRVWKLNVDIGIPVDIGITEELRDTTYPEYNTRDINASNIIIDTMVDAGILREVTPIEHDPNHAKFTPGEMWWEKC